LSTGRLSIPVPDVVLLQFPFFVPSSDNLDCLLFSFFSQHGLQSILVSIVVPSVPYGSRFFPQNLALCSPILPSFFLPSFGYDDGTWGSLSSLCFCRAIPLPHVFRETVLSLLLPLPENGPPLPLFPPCGAPYLSLPPRGISMSWYFLKPLNLPHTKSSRKTDNVLILYTVCRFHPGPPVFFFFHWHISPLLFSPPPLGGLMPIFSGPHPSVLFGTRVVPPGHFDFLLLE